MINSVQHLSWLHFISYLKEREREIENGEESTKKDRLAVSRNRAWMTEESQQNGKSGSSRR